MTGDPVCRNTSPEAPIGRETIQGYLADMLLVERALRSAIQQQRDGEPAQEAPAGHRLLDRIERRLGEHMDALEAVLAELGEDEAPMRSALAGILGATVGLFDRGLFDTTLSRVLRDDYAALGFTAMCCEMLHTTALALDEPGIAEIALRHLSDHARSIMEIGDLVPSVLAAELQRDGVILPDPAIVDRAQRNVRTAWSVGPEAGP